MIYLVECVVGSEFSQTISAHSSHHLWIIRKTPTTHKLLKLIIRISRKLIVQLLIGKMATPTTRTTTCHEKCSAYGEYFASDKTLKVHWTKTAGYFHVIKNLTQATLIALNAQTVNEPEQLDITTTLGLSSSTPATPTMSGSNLRLTSTSITERDSGFCMLLSEAYYSFLNTNLRFS